MKEVKQKESNFYIPLPKFTKKQEKWVYAISSAVIVLLVGVIVFLMYAMSNPEILTTTKRSEPTTVADVFSSTKEYTTEERKQYTGGIYVPTTEAPETTSTTVSHYQDKVVTGEEKPTEAVVTRPAQTEKNTTMAPSTTDPIKETTTAETTTEEETTAEETTTRQIEESFTLPQFTQWDFLSVYL